MNEIQSLVCIVKEARERKGWTQYTLAKKSGVSREMIAKFELGKHSPTLSTLRKLLSALSLQLTVTKKGEEP